MPADRTDREQDRTRLFYVRLLAVTALLAAAVFVLGWLTTSQTLGYSSYKSAFNSRYGTSGTKLDACETCHLPNTKNPRNPYGQALEVELAGGATIDQAMAAVEPLDSDGDGWSNLDEINARTWPGDASDYPTGGATPTPTPTPSGSPTPTPTPSAAITNIFGTDHDLSSPGNPVCEQCHTPHNAKSEYLWAMDPKSGMSGLQALCFSCHDGSVASKGQFIADPNYENHEVSPGTPGEDCDRCHDPHSNNWKFLSSDAIQPDYRNANVCSNCHGTGGFSHPLAQTNRPTDRIWDPYASPPDFSGTRLWDSSGTQVDTMGMGYMKCLTCHVPHGAVAGSKLNSMAYRDPNTGESPLCQNCHH